MFDLKTGFFIIIIILNFFLSLNKMIRQDDTILFLPKTFSRVMRIRMLTSFIC